MHETHPGVQVCFVASVAYSWVFGPANLSAGNALLILGSMIFRPLTSSSLNHTGHGLRDLPEDLPQVQTEVCRDSGVRETNWLYCFTQHAPDSNPQSQILVQMLPTAPCCCLQVGETEPFISELLTGLTGIIQVRLF